MQGLDEARNKLALANRILAHEGVLDGFGHVSMRHPTDPAQGLGILDDASAQSGGQYIWSDGQ